MLYLWSTPPPAPLASAPASALSLPARAATRCYALVRVATTQCVDSFLVCLFFFFCVIFAPLALSRIGRAQWAAFVFSYLFTWHALYVLRGEHQVFAEMREEYLTKGDPDFATQTRYTTKVLRLFFRECVRGCFAVCGCGWYWRFVLYL